MKKKKTANHYQNGLKDPSSQPTGIRGDVQTYTKTMDWENIFQAIGNPTLILSPDHTILAANHAALHTIDREVRGVIGEKCYKLFHNLDHPPEGCPLTQLVENDHMQKIETEMDVLGRTFLVSCTPIHNGDGHIKKVIHIATDITERKKTEKALKESEERYRDLFENANDLIQVINPDKTIAYVNRAWRATLGYTKEDLGHLRLSDIVHPDCRKKCNNLFQRLISGEPISGVEVQLLTKDGRKVVVEGNCNCRMKNGKPVSTRGIFRDITQRREAEKALDRLRHQHELILNSVGEGIFGLDINGKFTFVNPAAMSMLGYQEDEMIGSACGDILTHGEHAARRPPGRECAIAATYMDAQTHYGYNEVFWRKDGTPFPVEYVSTPIKENGKLIGAVVSFRDITERKEAEKENARMQAQLLQAQKMEAVGTLAAGVAHDFNNLLTAIQGYADIALLRLKRSDNLYKNINCISTACAKAADLVRQLLLFSRKQPMDLQLVNVNEIVEGLLKMLDRIIGEDIKIEVRLDPLAYNVKADPGRLEQVIMNLSVNARDAMPEGGKITIRTDNISLDERYCAAIPDAKPGRYLRLTIQDTGIGMDHETMEHIFEPFFSTKNTGKGTGLGLSVVYGIVRQHHGWINVYSEPGHGSSFRIYLPAVSEQLQDKRKKKMASVIARGNGESILIVEDEKLVREMAAGGLAQNGYRVYSANSIKEALELFDKQGHNFDLVFSDVVLPDGNGLHLADRLIKKNRGLKILMTSGYADEKSRWTIIKKRRFPFLQKPYSIPELLNTIHRVLSG